MPEGSQGCLLSAGDEAETMPLASSLEPIKPVFIDLGNPSDAGLLFEHQVAEPRSVY